MSGTEEEPWKLIYWPGIKGRGEYVRLIFEEAGAPYIDVGAKEGFDGVVNFVYKGGNPGFPARAPPAISKGTFTLCNTPVVQAYLGRQFGLMPADPQAQAHVEQVLAVVTDGVADGRLAFHPKDFYAKHKNQVEESKPYIVQYGKERLPKYMQHFEDILSKDASGSGWLVGGVFTVADIAVYQMMAAAEQHFKQYYDAVEAPKVKAHQKRVAERPRISAYLASPRCPPWDTDSMM